MSDKMTHKDKERAIGYDKLPPRPQSMWGTRWLTKLIHRSVVHDMWIERTLVDQTKTQSRAMKRSMAVRAFFAGILFVLGVWPEAFSPFLSPLLRGGVLGFGCYAFVSLPWWRAQAYDNGWWRGRNAMRFSMFEAMNRRLTMDEWIESELRRDFGENYTEDVPDDRD